MKKILAFLLILASVFSFVTTYNQIDQEELKTVTEVEEGLAKRFEIPYGFHPAVPDELYPLLYETALEYEVNIFRTNIHELEGAQPEMLKYILLTGDTHFFHDFRLKSGSFLTAQDTQQGDAFLSSADTGENSQRGIIRDFGGNNLLAIKPLKAAYEYLPVYGQYYVEVADNKAFEVFLEGFAAKVNEFHKKCGTNISYSPEIFQQQNHSEGAEVGARTDFLNYQKYMLLLIMLILLVYHIFYESKRIGILKMHGLSNISIWFIIAGKLITFVFLVSLVVSLPVALWIKDTTAQFVGSAILAQFKTYGIATAISLISYGYISRIKVSDAVKNRKDTQSIFVLNTLLKAGCSIMVILIGLSLWGQYIELRTKGEELKNWELSKDYGVFYPVVVGYDLEDLKKGFRYTTIALAGELYPTLNKMGALFIEADSYEESSLNYYLSKDWEGILSISVNPNYLREFPVYDVQNNPVQISEDTSEWILLVPEKYRHREAEIMSYFQQQRWGTQEPGGIYGAEETYFNREVPDRVRNQEIRIIWLANDQEIFSFNPEVFPAENNVILDPIIQVVTEKNSLGFDRANIINGGGGDDPLKMRLIDRDAALTLKTLEPELKRLKLDDNVKYLITVDQYVAEKVYYLQEWMKELVLTSLGLLVVLLLLVVQNLTLFFNKYQRKFIVRRLFGTGFFRTYKEYIGLFAATWLVQLLICYWVSKGAIAYFLELASRVSSVASAVSEVSGTATIKLVAVAAGLILIELSASVIALVLIEQRHRVKVLKGGN